jgi:hypothetical protein
VRDIYALLVACERCCEVGCLPTRRCAFFFARFFRAQNEKSKAQHLVTAAAVSWKDTPPRLNFCAASASDECSIENRQATPHSVSAIRSSFTAHILRHSFVCLLCVWCVCHLREREFKSSRECVCAWTRKNNLSCSQKPSSLPTNPIHSCTHVVVHITSTTHAHSWKPAFFFG